MDNTKLLLSYTRRAVDDYEMISDGDKIAVGVSAGKDSLTLLCALAQMRRFYPKKFEIIAITVNMKTTAKAWHRCPCTAPKMSRKALFIST